MRISSCILAAVCVVAAHAFSSAAPASTRQAAGNGTTYPNYRISPVDGSIIALPTADQLAFMDKEIGILIHFEIATYLSIDGCNNVPELVPDVDVFDPALLNTDQWMDSITALGAKYATLVAKHNCGFTIWPSTTTFETLYNQTTSYNYTIADSPVAPADVVQSFYDSAQKYGVGHGFYYSTVVNNFLNVQKSVVGTSYSDGQVRITNETYDEIVINQLTELWTKFGNLTEIWFDGGYSERQMEKIKALLQAYQPHASIFNSCDTNGTCISANANRWIGTETGETPSTGVWSTGVTNDGGDPTSPYFAPAVCDTTLQTGIRWFWGKDQPLRSIEEMIGVYHSTVGRNCLLELDLSPDRSGLVPARHAARYKQLGDFISSCYGGAVEGAAATEGVAAGEYSLVFERPTSIDRIVLMEDQTNGQVIRSYGVYAKVVDAQEANGTLAVPWTLVSNGTSVGHKRIDIFAEAVTVTEVLINSTFVDTPKWRSISVHLCDRLDED